MSRPSELEPRGVVRAAAIAGLVCGALALAGCAPTYTARSGGYYGNPSGQYYGGDARCYQGCGYVRDIREVRLGDARSGNSATLGTVLGAVLGGVLGNTVGKGDGRKAATVAGAVAGGFAGHAVGDQSNRGSDRGWQVVVQLSDGRYATVTQRSPPRVRVGDYAIIRANEVDRY